MDSTTPAAPPLGARAVLGIPQFRLLWLAQVISDFGDSLTNLALLIFVNQVTGSTAALATMAIALALPQVTFGLLAGVYVDRWNRKRVMIGADLLRGLLVLGFVGATLTDQLWLMFVIGFVQASIGTFFTPARGALMPHLVPRQGLLAANSLTQMSRIVAGVAGTAAAGAVIGLAGLVWPVFLVDALTFLVSALLVSRIVAPPQAAAPATAGHPRAIFAQLGDGLKVIAGSRVLKGTLLALGVTMLGLGAVNVLIVPLIVNDLQVPTTWFGAIELAQTSSMILSGGLVAMLAARLKAPTIVSLSLILLGGLTALISLVNGVWSLMLLLFVIGWVITPLQASVATIMQTAVDNELRGRIGAAMNTVMSAANLISMALAGAFGVFVGVRNVFVLAGLAAVLAGLAAAWVFRAPAATPTPAVEAEPSAP
jgi:MFS family permease